MSTFLHYVHCKDALLDCSAPGGERCESLTWVDEIVSCRTLPRAWKMLWTQMIFFVLYKCVFGCNVKHTDRWLLTNVTRFRTAACWFGWCWNEMVDILQVTHSHTFSWMKKWSRFWFNWHFSEGLNCKSALVQIVAQSVHVSSYLNMLNEKRKFKMWCKPCTMSLSNHIQFEISYFSI